MLAVLLLLIAVSASGQTLANPTRLPEHWKTFERRPPEKRLSCQIQPLQPQLNFGFRFQTGYVAEVPLRQYAGKGRQRWAAVMRVTPESEERDPVWFVARMRLAAVPENTKVSAEFGGAFLVGEGKYRVEMLLVDDQERVCTKSWTIRARLSDEVREIRPGLAPGVADDISLRRSGGRTPGTGETEPRFNVSVLLHAAATTPGRVRLRGFDRMLLMSALASMLERLPIRNVRLTVFNMDAQKELFHTEELSTASFRDAAEALNGLELGVVDYGTLQNRGGHLDLVSELLNRELGARDPPDAVVFLGPLARWTGRVADEALPEREGRRLVYNIQLRPWRAARAGLLPDTIARAVRRLGGRTKQVYSPEDFAEAIQELERLLEKSTPRGEAAEGS
jgi:hypothetical protein